MLIEVPLKKLDDEAKSLGLDLTEYLLFLEKANPLALDRGSKWLLELVKNAV